MRNVIMYAFRLTIGKMIEMSFLDNYKRVVIKIGSSTLTHAETGSLNFSKMERLVRSICDYRNSGMDVCLVSSGAIAVGRDVIGIKERPSDISIKQACAAVGQGRLMMTYQKLFSECVVYITDEGITVAVPAPADGLSTAQVATITDTIVKETDYTAPQIKVIEVKADAQDAQ